MSLTRPVALTAGVVLLVLWVVLAFVLAIPAGWVHLLLAVGICFLAAAITLTEPTGAADGSGLDVKVK
jgi:hypothetical protein